MIDTQWPTIRHELKRRDLDTHTCYEALKAFVPKSRLNIRNVSLLHPFDLLIYTALSMILRDDIAAARMPLHAQRVFSFRSEKASPRGGSRNSDSVISGSLASPTPPEGGDTKERGDEENETESR
ncbi:MAG: hypothetical protein OEY12_15760, partial [Nitrospira sp.]|nr:hypothetical protein [Nitrospira sp.]